MSATDQPVHAADPSEPLVIVTEELLSARMLRTLADETDARQFVVVMRPDQTLPVAALAPDVDAALTASLVTDAVKRVDPDGLVVGTVDRSGLRSCDLPAVVRGATLLGLIADLLDDDRVDVVDVIGRASDSLNVVSLATS
jgi:2-C-methyl-D-erythritol 4-phosphate cytidylyltransferase